MKKCSTCGHVYDDDSLNFCLDDGSPLSFLNNSLPTLVLPREALPPSNQALGRSANPKVIYALIIGLALLVGGGLVALLKSGAPEKASSESQNSLPQVARTPTTSNGSAPTPSSHQTSNNGIIVASPTKSDNGMQTPPRSAATTNGNPDLEAPIETEPKPLPRQNSTPKSALPKLEGIWSGRSQTTDRGDTHNFAMTVDFDENSVNDGNCPNQGRITSITQDMISIDWPQCGREAIRYSVANGRLTAHGSMVDISGNRNRPLGIKRSWTLTRR